jgi:F420-dependent oxidoreductase-like protein
MLLRRGVSLASVTALAGYGPRLFDETARLAEHAEAAGFDALFVPDHLMQNSVGGARDAPMFEAYSLLGALAVVTNSVQLGAFVSPVTFRHPPLLAKAVTTLDVISHGRAILGLGAGWDAEEHHLYGIPFPSAARRLTELEEALRACQAMLHRAERSAIGDTHEARHVPNQPPPVRAHIPILVGGGGERHTLRIVAQYADAANIAANDMDVVRRKLRVLSAHCADVGRDPASLHVTAFFVPDSGTHVASVARQLARLAVDGVILALTSGRTADIDEYGRILRDTFPQA